MNANFANTISTTGASSRNNGNGSRPVNALPCPGTRQRQPVASATYQLGPRIRQTEKDVDFAIYEDETAYEIPQPRREYYGSNLPALADISSGKKYTYAQHHVSHRERDGLINRAAMRGDDIGRNALIAGKRAYDEVPLNNGPSGATRYHRRWDKTQKKLFVELLQWMAPIMRDFRDSNICLVMEVRNSEDVRLMMESERAKNQLIKETFERLGLQNLTVERDGPNVLFIPCGADKHVVYRRDFTKEEQRYIDVLWPEQWAPGNERNLDELLRAAGYAR
ncbi:hypothetical protein ACHAPE_008406 [Trichoderma viride]